jgi:hypothetical protein
MGRLLVLGALIAFGCVLPCAAQGWVPRVEAVGMFGPGRHIETWYQEISPDTPYVVTSGRGLFVRGELTVRWPLVGLRADEIYVSALNEHSERFEQPWLGYRVVEVLLGPEVLAGVVGQSYRIMCDDTSGNPCWQWRYTSVGVTSHVPLGHSATYLDATLRGYVRVKEVDLDGHWTGLQFESRFGLRPNWNDVPLSFVFGYRFEQFSAEPAGVYPPFDEDISVLFIGIGVEIARPRRTR